MLWVDRECDQIRPSFIAIALTAMYTWAIPEKTFTQNYHAMQVSLAPKAMVILHTETLTSRVLMMHRPAVLCPGDSIAVATAYVLPDQKLSRGTDESNTWLGTSIFSAAGPLSDTPSLFGNIRFRGSRLRNTIKGVVVIGVWSLRHQSFKFNSLLDSLSYPLGGNFEDAHFGQARCFQDPLTKGQCPPVSESQFGIDKWDSGECENYGRCQMGVWGSSRTRVVRVDWNPEEIVRTKEG
ncbi:uncharacterized protein MELLADRAFT_112994 [Melampsora larici-populina 98AG31]|uniref:Uncharacterized protein n=1 Tax=Melampsora larici-populina (strain 98AG31 / pathotype 3-4-7) TaxID=747676 RepID=F4S8C6_MELLP|nr:uncharacterized protein MELLADRAFT_112994 [Melampsora larici-populina 98AG31]EGF99114.1 hypothetical protein MELLADRAFT_112994 [Melampsora larici-populina 98AG31]